MHTHNKHICNLNVGHMTKECRKNDMQRFLLALGLKKVITPTCIQCTEYFPNINNADILIWHKQFKLSLSVTKETRLQTFQYILNYRGIHCNKWICDKKNQE